MASKGEWGERLPLSVLLRRRGRALALPRRPPAAVTRPARIRAEGALRSPNRRRPLFSGVLR
jgi:hypothetical protein